ncbi:2-dehydro-3-deoxygalactonokinase [Thalassococcus sp. CAU 1522]|uniref:2-dehydro-3-deoxygalactonokinase n=1 Tax=Thalassococcus arenae TaxID=2851652 RepID=A0ABS6N2W3_9RHOB|nr:2-dehydro-3-deoxygalactonokinase [Thalassococcus arenae]MBV2358355.1 2-dehydro-3-deoxygalactonokinase [Thalassococcus arenae]
MNDAPAWIAVDWGTSSLRVWLMDAQGGVIRRHDSDQGMSRLGRADYEPALLDLVGDALPDGTSVPVLVCGMAGSRQGWAEAAYAATPCKPPALSQATRVTTADPRLDVRILPGIKQDRPADVMRGEESQIAGVFARHPDFDGVVCLPGTHCKWVQVSAGEVVSFRTFMTGEIFALLSRHSVLRHSVDDGWDDDAFAESVAHALSRPAGLAADLFTLRAEGLLHGLSPANAHARLSGLLIGLELAGARPYWLGQQVMVVGATGIARAYSNALAAQGLSPLQTDAEDITLAGLTAAFTAHRETTS